MLIYKFDRFSRNKYETAIHKKTLKDNGVKIISATEYVPDTPEGIILESMLEGYAEYYSFGSFSITCGLTCPIVSPLSIQVKLSNNSTFLSSTPIGQIMSSAIMSDTKYVGNLPPYISRSPFSSDTTTKNFVEQSIDRKKINAIKRKSRLMRKVYLQKWNFFVTLTYDNLKHTEESFKNYLLVFQCNDCRQNILWFGDNSCFRYSLLNTPYHFYLQV